MVTMDLRVLVIILKAVLVTECACPTSQITANLCEKGVVSGPSFYIDSVNMAEEFETCSCHLIAETSTRINIRDYSSSPKCQSYQYKANITLLGDNQLISYEYKNGQCEFPVLIGGSISPLHHWTFTIERRSTETANTSRDPEDPGFCVQVSADQGENFMISCKDPVHSVPETTSGSVTATTQTTTDLDGQSLTSTHTIPVVDVRTTSQTPAVSLQTTTSGNDKKEPEEDDRVLKPVIIASIAAGCVLFIVLILACVYTRRKCPKVYTSKDVDNIVYTPETKK